MADLGVDDEGVNGAGAVGDLDPFLVARRFVEDRFGPVLSAGGSGEGKRSEECGAAELKSGGVGKP